MQGTSSSSASISEPPTLGEHCLPNFPLRQAADPEINVRRRIAYGLTSDPTKIKIIREWPGRAVKGRNDIIKIPTIIKYGPVENNDPKRVDFDWGHKVGKDVNGVIRGFKLGLDPSKRAFYKKVSGVPAEDDKVPFHEETAAVEMQRLFRSPVDIVADYLGAVYKHAEARIRKAELAPIADLPKQFVITVPAIWSDVAKSATLVAARKAHPDLRLVNSGDLVTEPEAAALYTLHDLQNSGLRRGDTFVLCDAGGGTVDLISYYITSLKPRKRVKEIVAASGSYSPTLPHRAYYLLPKLITFPQAALPGP